MPAPRLERGPFGATCSLAGRDPGAGMEAAGDFFAFVFGRFAAEVAELAVGVCGTTATRHDEWGAKTPASRTSG